MNFGAKAICEKFKPSVHNDATVVSSDEKLEAMILSSLQAENGESLPNLLDHLTDQGLKDEATIRAMITRLLAEGKIELTRLRRLRVSPETEIQNRTEEKPRYQEAKAAAVARAGV